MMFSPPAWGWSGENREEVTFVDVLPTRVGMVRTPRTFPRLPLSSPHPRGDGPQTAPELGGRSQFSPPAWGWSGFASADPDYQLVLPTRVGMVRAERLVSSLRKSSPHPRGDGPTSALVSPADEMFSPPAWGWSATNDGEPIQPAVLPTRVGMVRSAMREWTA